MQLGGVRRVLMVCGVSLLGYCGYVLADAWWFQRVESAAWESAAEPAETAAGVVSTVAAAPALRPLDGRGVVGRLVIKRLGVSVMVMEGTTAKILRRAAGHIEGTALPGEPGNVGISAHRDTFFFPLRNIKRDDVLSMTTRAGEFRYRVVSISVVQPEDTGLLAAGEVEVLTLVTCYPFAFIGSAPERFIVRAERVI